MQLPPLAGYTVAVTADRRREEQVELLQRRGAEVLEGPTVRTAPLAADDARLRAAADAVIERPPDFMVFTTAVGTRGLVALAESTGRDEALLDAIAGSQVYVRGPKAAGAAVALGIDIEWRTTGDQAAEIVVELTEAARAGARIAVQRDGSNHADTARALAALGADVIDLPVYEWLMPADVAPAERLIDAVCAGTVDAVTFTSSPSLRNLVALADDLGRRDELLESLRGPVLAVCVGPVCSATAHDVGIERVAVPRVARLGAMVQALVIAMTGRTRHLVINGVDLTIQGSLVAIGEERVQLADRERRVLEALADAGGAVVPKRALLRTVWDDAADEHAVEATVGRLRRRLGQAGAAISTVPRRGYRLAMPVSIGSATS